LKTPEDVHQISIPWLASVFGVDPEKIESFGIELLEEGVGFTSEVFFVSPVGSFEPGELPRRVVVKQCASFEAAAKMSAETQLFEREARFYAEIAPELGIRTPRCYFAGFNPETERGLVMLEDCSHYSVRSQVDDVPTTVEELGALIDVLVALNRVADDPSLQKKDWLFKPGNQGFEHFFRMIGAN
jgi:hypothetical protein